MGEDRESHFVNELAEMLKEKKSGESVDKVFAVFCHRHGISIEECKKYYDKLAKTEKAKNSS